MVSNNKNAKGLTYAKRNNIKCEIVNYKNKKKAESKILKVLNKNNIDLICLAGFMKILSKRIINKYKNKILNIHPSLLPRYKGLNTHKRVILNKEKFTGCTVHYVDKFLDAGKIIIQRKVRITKKDNVKSIKKKVLKIEHKIYSQAIVKVLSTL